MLSVQFNQPVNSDQFHESFFLFFKLDLSCFKVVILNVDRMFEPFLISRMIFINIFSFLSAIPPQPSQQQQQQLFIPNLHGSSKSLNLMIGYKTQPQYPLQTVDTRSQRDVYNINSYTADLNYTTTPGSNRDIHSLFAGNEDNNINKPFLPSRQNSVVYSQNPRFSTYAYVSLLSFHISIFFRS